MRNFYFFISLACILSFSSCLEKLDDEFLYTFTGETITDYLDNRSETYSDFIQILTRGKMIGLLATRGSYTCFAPTNEAIAAYLKEKNIPCIDSISDEDIIEISYSHIINKSFLTTDWEEGAISSPNMNDRYLMVSFVADSMDLAILINKDSRILIKDEEVVNGVIHTINKVLSPSNSLLPDLMSLNNDISIFNEALLLTGLGDSLRGYIDVNWEPLPFIPTCYAYGSVKQPSKRKFGYTALVETDEVYQANGINDIEDLKQYAKNIYDEVYTKDKGKYDTLYTHRKNPLNRFVAYHLLNRTIYYNSFYYTISTVEGYEHYDYFETMCPQSIIRTSDSDEGTRLNRSNKWGIRGIQVLPTISSAYEQGAINGIYHYIDGLLVYDKTVREKVLNERIRVDVCSLMPEMMSNGLRQSKSRYVLNDSYLDNMSFSDDSRLFYNDPTSSNTCYQADEFTVEGPYDVTLRLPPVPEGIYEIRFGYFGKNTRGIAQLYFDSIPCGIPLDLTLYGENVPKIGWVLDANTDDEGREVDKMMRNRGYMKGPKSVRIWPAGTILRDRAAALRRIVTATYLSEDEPHYFRAKSVINNDQLGFLFDYIELCPKSIYDSEEGEDVY